MKLVTRKDTIHGWELRDLDYFPVSVAHLLVFGLYRNSEGRNALDFRLWRRRSEDEYVPTSKGIRTYSQGVIARMLSFVEKYQDLLPEKMTWEEAQEQKKKEERERKESPKKWPKKRLLSRPVGDDSCGGSGKV